MKTPSVLFIIMGVMGALAHQAHANPYNASAVAAQQSAAHYYATCGGPTPAYCQSSAPAAREYHNHLFAAVWLKPSHPKGSNVPLIYTSKVYSPNDSSWGFGSGQLSNYALAHCQKTYGADSCERSIYTWGSDNYVAVASPAKKGVNTFGAIEWHNTKAQAEQAAIASCQEEATSWNTNNPQLSYQPKDCQIIYSKSLRSAKGKNVHYRNFANY